MWQVLKENNNSMGIIKKTVDNDIKQQAENTKKDAAEYGPSKYEQAFKKYDLNVDEKAVDEAVKKIIAEKVPENDNMEVKKFLLGSVELTSLHTTDTDESILAMTEKRE